MADDSRSTLSPSYVWFAEHGERELDVVDFSVDEAMSTMFSLVVRASTQNGKLTPSSFIGKGAAFRFAHHAGDLVWAGICSEASAGQQPAGRRGHGLDVRVHHRARAVAHHAAPEQPHLPADDGPSDRREDPRGMGAAAQLRPQGGPPDPRLSRPVPRVGLRVHDPPPRGGGNLLLVRSRDQVGTGLGGHVDRLLRSAAGPAAASREGFRIARVARRSSTARTSSSTCGSRRT